MITDEQLDEWAHSLDTWMGPGDIWLYPHKDPFDDIRELLERQKIVRSLIEEVRRFRQDQPINPDPIELIHIRKKCLNEADGIFYDPKKIPVSPEEYSILRNYCEIVDFPFTGKIVIDDVDELIITG